MVIVRPLVHARLWLRVTRGNAVDRLLLSGLCRPGRWEAKSSVGVQGAPAGRARPPSPRHGPRMGEGVGEGEHQGSCVRHALSLSGHPVSRFLPYHTRRQHHDICTIGCTIGPTGQYLPSGTGPLVSDGVGVTASKDIISNTDANEPRTRAVFLAELTRLVVSSSNSGIMPGLAFCSKVRNESWVIGVSEECVGRRVLQLQ